MNYEKKSLGARAGGPRTTPHRVRVTEHNASNHRRIKNAERPLSWFHAFHLPALSRSRGRMPVYLGGHRTLCVALWTLGPSCGGLCNSARWCELHVGASLRLGLRLAEQTEEG